MLMNLKCVSVLKHFRSMNATKYYRYSAQRKAIADIDISNCRDMNDFQLLWKETIDDDGKFTLIAKNSRGRLFKGIGDIVVRGGSINVIDKRCTLASLFRKNEERILKEEESDWEMTGR